MPDVRGGRERLVTIACNPWPLPEWEENGVLVLLRGGIQALVTVELNALSNYCAIGYNYSPAVFQLGMSNTPLLTYTRVTHS